MNLLKSSLENIRNLRKQKLSELLFPSFGARQERIMYGGKVHIFVNENEQIGYYINKDIEILDFYVKKEFDHLADDCFRIVLEELVEPVVNIRSDDSLLINLVFNYLMDLDKGGYLMVRDRRHILNEMNSPLLKFSAISPDVFDECWEILSAEDSFYGGCDSSQKEMVKSFIGKDMFFCLLEDFKVIGIGYHQAARNKCAEIGFVMHRDYRNSNYIILLISALTRLIEHKGYQCFTELSRLNNSERELMEKLGFYVIAKYFTARIKGKIEEGNKKRNRRYSLTGLFRVL